MTLFYHYADRDSLAQILREGITYGGAMMDDAADGTKRIGLSRYRAPCRFGHHELPWPEAQQQECEFWDEKRAEHDRCFVGRTDAAEFPFETWKRDTIEFCRLSTPTPGRIRVTVELAEDDPKLSRAGPAMDLRPEMWMAHLGTIPASAIREVIDVETGVGLWSAASD